MTLRELLWWAVRAAEDLSLGIALVFVAFVAWWVLW
jgi:hypothetical protein